MFIREGHQAGLMMAQDKFFVASRTIPMPLLKLASSITAIFLLATILLPDIGLINLN